MWTLEGNMLIDEEDETASHELERWELNIIDNIRQLTRKRLPPDKVEHFVNELFHSTGISTLAELEEAVSDWACIDSYL